MNILTTDLGETWRRVRRAFNEAWREAPFPWDGERPPAGLVALCRILDRLEERLNRTPPAPATKSPWRVD